MINIHANVILRFRLYAVSKLSGKKTQYQSVTAGFLRKQILTDFCNSRYGLLCPVSSARATWKTFVGKLLLEIAKNDYLS